MSRMAAVTRIPSARLQRAQHDLDRELGTVLPQRGQFDPGPDLLRQSVVRRPQIVGDQPFGETLRG